MPKIIEQKCARGACIFVKLEGDTTTCGCASEEMTGRKIIPTFKTLGAELSAGGERAERARMAISIANATLESREIEQEPLERGIGMVALQRVNERIGMRA